MSALLRHNAYKKGNKNAEFAGISIDNIAGHENDYADVLQLIIGADQMEEVENDEYQPMSKDDFRAKSTELFQKKLMGMSTSLKQ